MIWWSDCENHVFSIYCAPFQQDDIKHILCTLPTRWYEQFGLKPWNYAGSTTILVAPLRGIQAQLKSDCDKAGISAVVGEQVEQVTLFFNWCFKLPVWARQVQGGAQEKSTTFDLFAGVPWQEWGLWHDYRLAVNLHRSQVRDTLLECRLAPVGTRPIVCIDECQVTIPVLWKFILLQPGTWLFSGPSQSRQALVDDFTYFRYWTRLSVGLVFAKATVSQHGCGLLLRWGQGKSPTYVHKCHKCVTGA